MDCSNHRFGPDFPQVSSPNVSVADTSFHDLVLPGIELKSRRQVCLSNNYACPLFVDRRNYWTG
jgi:hypothetical protein